MMSSTASGDKSPFKLGQAKRTLPLFDDHSDRKLLKMLEDKVEALQQMTKKAKSSSPNPSKYTQLSMSNYCRGTPKSGHASSVKDRPPKKPVIKRTKKTSSSDKKKEISTGKVATPKKRKKSKQDKTENLPRLDGWLSRRDSSKIKTDIVKEKVKNKDKKESKVNKETEVLVENKAEKVSRKLKRQSSGSFDKYGIHLPSFEDIVAYQKKIKADTKCLDSIHISEDSQDDFNIEEPELPQILDCKDLSENDIEEAYNSNRQYTHEIFHGIRYSSRHERFQRENLEDNFTVNDLKYNTSTITFNYEQKRQLLSRLRKQFDAEDGSSNQYFYKVLLPELCLKIFMDTHNMSHEEATTYLESRPVMVY